MGKKILLLFLTGLLCLQGVTTALADKGGVTRFATLPPGPGHPEGLAADQQGNIYVATFEFSGTNLIHIFRATNGQLLDSIPLPGAVPLGLAFDTLGNLYVADFGNGRVLRLSPPFTHSSTPSAVFPVCGGANNGCGLNAMAFDAAGDLYVSDSFGGHVFKIDLPAGTVSTFVNDDLLQPGSHGFPPFGANGLAFSSDEKIFSSRTPPTTVS